MLQIAENRAKAEAILQARKMGSIKGLRRLCDESNWMGYFLEFALMVVLEHDDHSDADFIKSLVKNKTWHIEQRIHNA